jgi:hypothetical protein
MSSACSGIGFGSADICTINEHGIKMQFYYDADLFLSCPELSLIGLKPCVLTKEIPCFYGTQMLTAFFTTACHWPCYCFITQK